MFYKKSISKLLFFSFLFTDFTFLTASATETVLEMAKVPTKNWENYVVYALVDGQRIQFGHLRTDSQNIKQQLESQKWQIFLTVNGYYIDHQPTKI